MLVTVKTEKQVNIEKYYMLRGIEKTQNGYTVVAEKEFKEPPSLVEIAQFITESKCDFASVVENFRVDDNVLTF